MFGVSFAFLYKLTRQIKRDHALALGLWASGWLDARLLATIIADPQQADAAQLATWVADCDNRSFAGAVAKFAAGTALAEATAVKWCADEREFVAVLAGM